MSGEIDPKRQFVYGYHFIKRNVNGGILMEIWQDVGDSNTEPGQQWKKIYSGPEKKGWNNPPKDHKP